MYGDALERAPLSAETRRTYRSRTRVYLAWLAAHATAYDADPLTNIQARDWAVRDYRMWLLRDGPVRRSRVYVNSALTALDDFHTRRGLGKANVSREDLPKSAPRALEERARIRWLRAVEAHLSPRDRCIALIPYYAGARISEVVRLDVDDVHLSARKGKLRLYGKGDNFREVDIHPKLRAELQIWLDERPTWPEADASRALFLNAKGGRLTARAASGIIATIAQRSGLDDPTTTHVLRHTLATTLVRGKTDLVLVAEILGHARLETTRRYSLPSDKDKEDALKLITTDD
ncbi:tyrosine-type recombinase/integrase [Streptosporangium sp. NPDC087985]|uniref:tyrosine-type recombinase/integrase n=1 Tax=Streptosporangium sp. NPDC087985 TaxID=3366196 RepID=UPI0037FBF05F